jgi:hypothetical protein
MTEAYLGIRTSADLLRIAQADYEEVTAGRDAGQQGRLRELEQEQRQSVQRSSGGCLGNISSVWGKEKIQHYQWAFAGEKYCNVLSTASSQVPNWEEASTKLNQLILRRIQMRGRQPLKFSINPINLIDLENLKRWQDQNLYIKMNDHESASLHYRQLTLNDIPDTYGFDKYGLIVQGEFASGTQARAATRHSTNQQVELETQGHVVHDSGQISAETVATPSISDITPEENGFDSALDAQTTLPSPEVEKAVFFRAESTSEYDSSGLSSPLSLRSPTTSPEPEATPENGQMRLRASERRHFPPKVPYNTSIAKTSGTSRSRASRTSRGKRLCHCPSRIPKIFVEHLDNRTGSSQSTPGILVVEQLTPYQHMLCVKHLLIFAQITSAIVLSHRVVIETDSLTLGHLINIGRRSRSPPDISSDFPPHKRRRLEEVLSSNSPSA